jgi:hypothetical protein
VSYLKLPKGVQDYGVGFRSVRQVDDNGEAIYDTLDAKHALGNDGSNTSSFTNPLDAIGRHEDFLIARTVVKFKVDTTPSTPTITPLLAGPLLGLLSVGRYGTGQWRIYFAAGIAFLAAVQMPAASAVDYKANCYKFYDPSTGHGYIVTTWAIDTGVWVPTDLDFDLAIWAQR